MLIFVLTFLTIVIFTRSLKKDIEIYNTKVTNEEIIDEYGWKQVCNDVFRKPIHCEILSALVGTGIQIMIMITYTLFFAVPGLRFAYAIMNNPVYKQVIDITTTNTNIATLSAIAVTEMLSDKKYIEDSISMIHTERNLVYAAMATSRAIKLTQPDANFMLCKLLNPDVNSSTVADHCNQRGVIIRKCDNIPGLSDRYIRFCFMKPKQNDLMVNTILEVV